MLAGVSDDGRHLSHAFGEGKHLGRAASNRAAHRLILASRKVRNSTCQVPWPEKACTRCKTAGNGRCVPQFRWSWNSPLEANDAGSFIPGLRTVRGMQALDEPHVHVVAQWNQSNWPGLIVGSPVNAASAADRRKLCTLWKSEHSYQSWPVLLGCPRFRPQEFEKTCSNRGAVIEVDCALIDLASGPEVIGDVYDASRWLRASHWMHPPEPCKSTKSFRIPRIGTALSVYPFAMGHFVPEQLPSILVLHATLPADVPILVVDAPIVRRYLTPLFEVGVLARGRILWHDPSRAGQVMWIMIGTCPLPNLSPLAHASR